MRTWKLLEDEIVIPDDAVIHPSYVYIIDNVIARSIVTWSMTIKEYKRLTGAKEIRRCNIYHTIRALAFIGDRVE